MEKKDLIEYSPISYFEKTTNANLKDGELGLITAKKGLGKTSVLVQFGIDSLIKDKALLHVSFDQQSSNVISWYSSILSEITKKKNINIDLIIEDIMKKRTILNFNQETFTLPKVVNTMKSLKEAEIKIDSIVIDGLNLAAVELDDLKCFADYVKDEKMTAWFSYTSEASTIKDTLDSKKIDYFTTVAHLATEGKDLSLTVIKNGDGKVSLNTKTLLISK